MTNSTIEKSGDIWQELIQTCILGAGRRQPLMVAEKSLGQIITDINSDNRDFSKEEKILQALTATSLALKAGKNLTSSNSLPPPPAPCPEENQEICSQYSLSLLKHIMADQGKGNEQRRMKLTRDWLQFCSDAGYILPAQFLPRLIDFAADKNELHQLLQDCGGSHFDWLLHLNREWGTTFSQNALGTMNKEKLSEKVEIGFDQERITALAQLRRLAPETARDCLVELWPRESFEQKMVMLRTLEIELSMDDEIFLEETVLNDRRKEIRLVASALLAKLKESRLVARMLERARTMVSVLEGKIEITLPSEFDKTMARDGIEENLSIDSRIGQKAAWLYQIVSLVDPSFWQNQFALSAAEILQLVLSSQDWSLPLVLSLLNASAQYSNGDFQDAIIAQEQIHLTETTAGQNFLRKLPHQKLEKLITGKLPSWEKTDRLSAPRLDLWYYLELVDFQWSEPFSVSLLRFIIKEIKERVPVFGHTFYSNATNFGLRMHVGAGKYLADLNLAVEEIDTWTRNGLERFIDNLKLRYEMKLSFEQEKEA